MRRRWDRGRVLYFLCVAVVWAGGRWGGFLFCGYVGDGVFGEFLTEFFVGAQGHEGPVVAIHVVAQVEDFGEAGAGGLGLGPGAVGVLGVEEVADAGLEGGAEGVATGDQAHDGPGGLGGGGGAFAFVGGVVVGGTGFAPAAVGVLAAFEPVAGADDPVLVHVLADGLEAAKGLEGAVDVVDAPAAPPGAVAFLGAFEHFDATADGRVGGGEAEFAKAFEDFGGDVGAGGVEDGVVVGKGDVFEPFFGDVFVEGSPAAVFALEGEEPAGGAVEDLLFLGGLVPVDEPEGEEDFGGVVNVGVVDVVVFEGPAGGFGVGVFDFPVAAEVVDFFLGEPVGGFLECGVVGGQAGVGQGDGGDGGVPDGGEAGLDAQVAGGGVFNVEALEVVADFLDGGVVVGVAEAFEGHKAKDDGWKDGAKAVGALADALENPLFGVFECAGAEGFPGEFVEEFECVVPAQEEVAPGEELAVVFEGEVVGFCAVGEEFVDVFFGGDVFGGAEVVDDGERDEHGARP